MEHELSAFYDITRWLGLAIHVTGVAGALKALDKWLKQSGYY